MAAMTPSRPPMMAPQQEDIYLTLLISSAVLLLIGLIVVAVRSYELFGSLWPPSAA